MSFHSRVFKDLANKISRRLKGLSVVRNDSCGYTSPGCESLEAPNEGKCIQIGYQLQVYCSNGATNEQAQPDLMLTLDISRLDV